MLNLIKLHLQLFFINNKKTIRTNKDIIKLFNLLTDFKYYFKKKIYIVSKLNFIFNMYNKYITTFTNIYLKKLKKYSNGLYINRDRTKLVIYFLDLTLFLLKKKYINILNFYYNKNEILNIFRKIKYITFYRNIYIDFLIRIFLDIHKKNIKTNTNFFIEINPLFIYILKYLNILLFFNEKKKFNNTKKTLVIIFQILNYLNYLKKLSKYINTSGFILSINMIFKNIISIGKLEDFKINHRLLKKLLNKLFINFSNIGNISIYFKKKYNNYQDIFGILNKNYNVIFNLLFLDIKKNNNFFNISKNIKFRYFYKKLLQKNYNITTLTYKQKISKNNHF